MDLTVDDGRVDHLADVVDGDVAQEVDRTGLGVDLDDGDVRAGGPAEVLRIEDVRRLEPGLHPVREVVRGPRLQRQLLRRLPVASRFGQMVPPSPQGEPRRIAG